MTFLGIENLNEFFTQHYLAAILQGDLRPVLERWRGTAKTAGSGEIRQLPPQALGASHQTFFRYLDRLEQQPSIEIRVQAHFEMYCELLPQGSLGKIGPSPRPDEVQRSYAGVGP